MCSFDFYVEFRTLFHDRQMYDERHEPVCTQARVVTSLLHLHSLRLQLYNQQHYNMPFAGGWQCWLRPTLGNN